MLRLHVNLEGILPLFKPTAVRLFLRDLRVRW